MKTETIRLYSLNFNEVKTYLTALIFILGNIILPQLFHFIPNGGIMFLPIYFFTLVAAYKYGIKAGLLTALLSPLVNYLLFGMPALQMLPVIIIKSSLLALAASFAATYFKRISILILVLVVLSYQLAGTLVEFLFVGDIYIALQDFRIGIPGMILQIIGGYWLIKALK